MLTGSHLIPRLPPALAPLALSVMGLGACQAPPLPESTVEGSSASLAVDWTARLGPRDLVHVAVFGQPDYSTPEAGTRVGADGTLGLPLLGAFPVAELTPAEAGAAIEEELRAWLKEPSVTVTVLEGASRRFHILGDVSLPGPHAMDGPLTALEALSLGGQPRPGARLDPVVIVRRRGTEDIEVIPFNAETPGVDGLVQIQPEDVLFVPRSGVGVFREEYFPYLQGIGLSVGQISSLIVAGNRVD